jgi:hypothetical protein
MSNMDVYVAEPTIGTGGLAVPSAYRPLRNSGSVNIRAENLMYDATKLVALLEEARAPANLAAASSSDTVSVTSTLRGGAAIAGAFGLVCGIGSALSGVTLMHPLLSLVLILGSLGFCAMSFVRQ